MAGGGRIASISIMTETATSHSMTLLVVMAWPCSSNPARTDAAFNQHQWGLPLPCLPACALGLRGHLGRPQRAEMTWRSIAAGASLLACLAEALGTTFTTAIWASSS